MFAKGDYAVWPKIMLSICPKAGRYCGIICMSALEILSRPERHRWCISSLFQTQQMRVNNLLLSLPIACSMDQIRELEPLTDPDERLPFIRDILSALRQEVGSASTVLGFIGAPWTLAAYSVEGKADK